MGPHLPDSGIYKIEHVASGRMYVGSACNVSRRIGRHLTELNSGSHCNAKLQRAWHKYGASEFKCSVLLMCAPRDLIMYEQRAINAFDAVATGYNICPTAGSILGTKKAPSGVEKTAAAHRGMKRSEETRAKIRAARARQVITPEAKEKIAAANRGRIASGETRAKLSVANRGRKASPEEIAKNRAKQIGKKPSPATIAKMVAARAWYRPSKEAIEKLVKWNTGRKMSAEAIAKSVAARAGYVTSAETRAKISAAGKGKPKSAETRAKMRESQLKRGWRPSTVMIEAARRANLGKKFGPEIIAKRVATMARNKALRAAPGRAYQA